MSHTGLQQLTFSRQESTTYNMHNGGLLWF